jgi:membrane-bound ClpP family serine protease
MTDATAARRRAELRGREAVARWRITSGVWAGRIYAAFFVALALIALERSGRDWPSAIILLVTAGAVLLAAERMRQGSRAAALALLGLFVGAKVTAWFISGQPIWTGALWSLILGGAMVNGIWGAFVLARVRAESSTREESSPWVGP